MYSDRNVPGIFQYTIDNSPWIEMPDADWSLLTRSLAPKIYEKGSVIYDQESSQSPASVFLIKAGRIRMDIYNHTGDCKSLYVAGPGTIFGEISPLDHLPNICCASASIRSEVYHIPQARFLEVIETDRQCALNVMQIMARKTRLMANSIKQLAFDHSTARVAFALTNLARQYARETPEGVQLTMKFTHQEMADLTGLSRVSVSNIFIQLTNKNILSKNNGYLVIRDMDALYRCLM